MCLAGKMYTCGLFIDMSVTTADAAFLLTVLRTMVLLLFLVSCHTEEYSSEESYVPMVTWKP